MRKPLDSPPPKPGLVDLDNHLWLKFWRDERTDFHQSAVNPLLSKFWSSLDLAPGSRVFVPLCGKSLDMIWLAQQGHEVIGLELSPLAVHAFFSENHMQPTCRQVGRFTLWQSGCISILCGDFFAVNRAELGEVDVVYDRAALTALPEDVRRLYVAHLKLILPAACKMFLLTVEDADEGETQEVTLGSSAEITALYSEAFWIELAHVESVMESSSDESEYERCSEHKVYLLTPK